MRRKNDSQRDHERAERLVREERVVAVILDNDKLMAQVREALVDEKQGKGVSGKDLKRRNAGH